MNFNKKYMKYKKNKSKSKIKDYSLKYDGYLIVKSLNELRYFNIHTQEYLYSKPTHNIKNIIVFVSDFDTYKNYIIELYKQFLLINCDLMCPCLFDDKKCLTYFGGYVLNKKIEIYDEQHYPNLNKLDEIFYNKRTNILFRNFFIAKTQKSIEQIINNLNTFQFTDLICVVTPYVQITYNRSYVYKKNIQSKNIIQNIPIENEIIVDNSLTSKKYFTGDIILKNQKTVLICENSCLTPSKDCGSKYIYEFIKLLLHKNYKVHFFSSSNFAYLPETEFLKQSGVYIHYNRTNFTYKSLENFLKNNVIYFDYIFLSRGNICHNDKNIVKKICPSSKLIYITHDISHVRLGDKHKMEQQKKIELNNIKFCDMSLIVSSDEMSYLKSLHIDENKIFYYPICYKNVDITKRLSINETKDIYFIGSSHPPNIEALENFLKNIWCHILKIDSNIKFHIIGSSGYSIKETYENVIIHGLICDDELNIFLNNTRVNIVPLLSGAGMKGKVLQAFNNNIPVITTNIGIQGMDVKHMSEVLVIDLNDSVKCARDICNYYNNLEILKKCSNNAYRYFNSNFNMEKSSIYMNKMFQKLDSTSFKICTKPYRCLIMCIVYSYEYSIKMIYDFFKKILIDIPYTLYFIINNTDLYEKINENYNHMKNVFIVEGDNSCHEFSGYQSLINKMKNNQINNFDSILLTNETLLTHFPINHITNLNKEIFISTFKNVIACGLIDRYSFNCKFNSINLGEWIRGNFILMNMNILKDLNYKVQNFSSKIIDNNGNFKLSISKKYKNVINNWLLNERYIKMTKEQIAIKKTCILNEQYFGGIILSNYKYLDLRI